MEEITITVTAQANEGFQFLHWFKYDYIVSDQEEYTFTAEEDRSLTAVFVSLIAGDVNSNGKIDVIDAIMVLRYIAGLQILDQAALRRARVSSSTGEVDVGDAILILRHIVGLITEFPAESQ